MKGRWWAKQKRMKIWLQCDSKKLIYNSVIGGNFSGWLGGSNQIGNMGSTCISFTILKILVNNKQDVSECVLKSAGYCCNGRDCCPRPHTSCDYLWHQKATRGPLATRTGCVQPHWIPRGSPHVDCRTWIYILRDSHTLGSFFCPQASV